MPKRRQSTTTTNNDVDDGLFSFEQTTATNNDNTSDNNNNNNNNNSNPNHKQRSAKSGSSNSSSNSTSSTNGNDKKNSNSNRNMRNKNNTKRTSFIHWVLGNKYYITLCLIIGFFVGLGLGIVFFIDDYGQLQNFLPGVDGSTDDGIVKNLFGLWVGLWKAAFTSNSNSSRSESKSSHQHKNKHKNTHSSSGEYDFDAPYKYVTVNGRSVRDDASHPLTFAILRESIIREKGGYVHPDLGLLVPAPCGASRGLGMVRDSYNTCQVRCMPGINTEKVKKVKEEKKMKRDRENKKKSTTNDNGANNDGNGDSEREKDDETDSGDTYPPFWNAPADELNTIEKLRHALDEQESTDAKYSQEEVLLRIPLRAQMTRSTALATLLPIIPHNVLVRAPLHELDDAALLVLLLAHERGSGIESTFHPYISSLPLVPSCGFSNSNGVRADALETISIMGVQLGMDVNGWPGELSKAGDRAHMITEGLARDYGGYINVPKGMTPFATLQWALCHVASRATAASEKHGALRMVPILDMVNHDVVAGGFEELGGTERLQRGNFVDATEDDSGTFIVRSVRHGRRKPLKKGQELLVNYNVPNYSPLDWFISLGFVPPERSGKWTKVEDVLPKSRTYGNKS
eukprot:CAMPEP_0203669214 /NCGR_PEP_ID=MMETSP0090-20130426/5636_1 /ASSEMBLY_ACC=CAM_ASM_001088 /TAXON_ID=426623 /ORGANISM="Chaetoceros affinis, Strain CCMP159" /LENGTH=627 /DNA_ID=CAMNT_0050533835 /DNA_START=62 /DNA_END=1945 /DNA_ORIENTATION=-